MADGCVSVVDLFAGPGGLGEGFSSLLGGKAFRIAVSAEKEESAHRTLQLRSFFRLTRGHSTDQRSYYRYCSGETDLPYDDRTISAWTEAGDEARRLTLGTSADNRELDQLLDDRIGKEEEWVLIGGPPCQAYSLVGRSRNRGKADYAAESDHRHFLYKEYLRIIQRRRPAVFVMENVKGILSSQVGGERIFPNILRDLSDPDRALGCRRSQGEQGYRIHSLVCESVFERDRSPESINPGDYIVRSERYGIPQARHRVILLGVREDIKVRPKVLVQSPRSTVEDAIGDLPVLRSRLSKAIDGPLEWQRFVSEQLTELASDSRKLGAREVEHAFLTAASSVEHDLPTGGLRTPRERKSNEVESALQKWYRDDALTVWLNHEARGHMPADLRRYAYSSVLAQFTGRSPKGHEEFNLTGLRPNHKNWESGKFSDRFRVQLRNEPSTTITSHISKDGHYYIHPDPAQCRSLTVREAARLQTFPDNYFFEGNRTQQFHQVGNAVPPWLARQIAKVVRGILANA